MACLGKRMVGFANAISERGQPNHLGIPVVQNEKVAMVCETLRDVGRMLAVRGQRLV